MLCTRFALLTSIVFTSCLLIGCIGGEKKLKYLGDADLQYYRDTTMQVDYPYIGQESPDSVKLAQEPRRIRDKRKDEIWDLTLNEAIQTSLINSEVIRDSAQFLSSGNTLLTRPDFANTVYDPAIQESGVLFGQRGVEAALADFDATLTTTMRWGRNEQVSEQPNIGFAAGNTIIEESGQYRSVIAKNFADSSSISMEHNIEYSGRNQQFGAGTRLFPSHFTALPPDIPTFGIEFRRPFWAGAGTEFTRIAGPIRDSLGGVSGVSQGVVIARINNDISLADFEAAVRNLIKDVEDVYWDLYLAYRTYDSELISRNSSLRTWQEVKVKGEVGAPGGGAADEAQGRDNYFEIRARTENALSNIYSTETRLRRLLGLAVNDGRIIRPADEPITAEFRPDWMTSLAEALSRRVELRRQKWNIKSLELQVQAAHSLTRPRFDFVSGYQVNGFGDRLFSNRPGPFSGLYRSAFRGDQTGWNLGFEFSMPFGFRSANSQVSNLELKLAKARTILAAQELEISHELASAYQSLDRSYTTAVTNFNRRRAAERRVQAFEAEFRAGRTTLDLLLRSQISLAQAEIAYYQSVIDYNKSINELEYRKGTMLTSKHVHLSESLSTPRAYLEALRRAWSRSYAFDADHLHTEPAEFVFPQYEYSVEYESADENGEQSGEPALPPEPVPADSTDAAADTQAQAIPATSPFDSKQDTVNAAASELQQPIGYDPQQALPVTNRKQAPAQLESPFFSDERDVQRTEVKERSENPKRPIEASPYFDASYKPFSRAPKTEEPVMNKGKIQQVEFESSMSSQVDGKLDDAQPNFGSPNETRDSETKATPERKTSEKKTSEKKTWPMKKRLSNWGVFWKRDK